MMSRYSRRHRQFAPKRRQEIPYREIVVIIAVIAIIAVIIFGIAKCSSNTVFKKDTCPTECKPSCADYEIENQRDTCSEGVCCADPFATP